MTDEKRIQKALSSLGFYHGQIDGQINSYETRSAIKAMNTAYEISHNASLKPEAKDMLIYLGTLFAFDRYLIASSNDKRTKGKRLQAALKVLGYYYGKIDGAIGPGSKAAIAQFKADHGMSYGDHLNFEEEYQLVHTAKEKNDKNIDDSIMSLKSLGSGTKHQNQQPSVLRLNVPHQEEGTQSANTDRQANTPH